MRNGKMWLNKGMRIRNIPFKEYTQAQPMLLPPEIGELIPETHLVRVVNQIIDGIDINALIEDYKGGGTSSYHPKMMLKVVVYAYLDKVYTTRRIAKALRENVNYMWLAGNNKPDFRTIARFRTSKLEGKIRNIFEYVITTLVEMGYVKIEDYLVDGTKIEADANAHKMVWKKKVKKNKGRLQEQIRELLQEIEEVNRAEDEAYGDKDLEELGNAAGVNTERLKEIIDKINEQIGEQPKQKQVKKAVKQLEKKYLPRLESYEEQERILAGRSSYSKTDPDASGMIRKEERATMKPWPRPAYNVQIGVEGQFIIGFSVHQTAGDTGCFIPHMEQQSWPKGKKPRRICTDAAYGSEENYAYLQQNRHENYLKYNTFYQDTHPSRKPEQQQSARFRSENFAYDPETDVFICPAGKPMSYQETIPHLSQNGYLSERRIYECQQCTDCPLKAHCTEAQGNRRIQVSFELRNFRQQARENLLSEYGGLLQKRRSTEVEGIFGNIKHNSGFRRFHVRGIKKVEIEWGLVCLAYNFRILGKMKEKNR